MKQSRKTLLFGMLVFAFGVLYSMIYVRVPYKDGSPEFGKVIYRQEQISKSILNLGGTLFLIGLVWDVVGMSKPAKVVRPAKTSKVVKSVKRKKKK